MKKKEKRPAVFEDDGRTICSMDVEGMPWHSGPSGRGKYSEEREKLKNKVDNGEPLTRREYRRYTWYSVLAGLAVLGFVGGGTVLFIFILWLLWH